jgi:hypothetical protein
MPAFEAPLGHRRQHLALAPSEVVERVLDAAGGDLLNVTALADKGRSRSDRVQASQTLAEENLVVRGDHPRAGFGHAVDYGAR